MWKEDRQDPRVVVCPGYVGEAQESQGKGGALAVEVVALVGDSVVDVRHLVAGVPARKLRARTLFVAGACALFGALVVCGVALEAVARERAELALWTQGGRDARTFPRYVRLSRGMDALT